MVETASLLTPAVNYAVVQLPGRRFPGVVVQGDSLHSIVSMLRNIKSDLSNNDLDEANAGVEVISEILSSALKHYESVCDEQGIELPYARG